MLHLYSSFTCAKESGLKGCTWNRSARFTVVANRTWTYIAVCFIVLAVCLDPMKTERVQEGRETL